MQRWQPGVRRSGRSRGRSRPSWAHLLLLFLLLLLRIVGLVSPESTSSPLGPRANDPMLSCAVSTRQSPIATLLHLASLCHQRASSLGPGSAGCTGGRHVAVVSLPRASSGSVALRPFQRRSHRQRGIAHPKQTWLPLSHPASLRRACVPAAHNRAAARPSHSFRLGQPRGDRQAAPQKARGRGDKAGAT